MKGSKAGDHKKLNDSFSLIKTQQHLREEQIEGTLNTAVCFVCEAPLRYEWQQRYEDKDGRKVCGFACANDHTEIAVVYARPSGET